MYRFKILISTLIVMFCMNITLNGQCPDDLFITFSTQYDLDTFGLNYPNCTTIRSLNLRGSITDPITDLSALNNIDTLESTLSIKEQSALNSLVGLDNLMSCGNFIIEDNAVLENLNGLESLQSIGTLQIKNCPELSNTLGLQNLRVSYGRFEIENNATLSEIGSFPLLDTIQFNLIIESNPVLTEIVGFNSLKTVDRSVFSIKNNSSLIKVEGFNALEYVDEDFTIAGPSLQEVKGFNSLLTLNSDLIFSETTALQSVEGFENLTSAHSIEIERNENLTTLPQFDNCKYIDEQISILSNQSLGSIDIFNQLDSVGFSVTISLNNILKTINGFESLTKTGFHLKIEQNEQLESIPTFQNLTSTRDIFIKQNDALTSILGFPNLVNALNIELSRNVSLTSVTDFPSLQLVVGNLKIEENPLLQNYPELPALTKIVNHLWIHENDQLQFLNTAPLLDTVNIIYLVGNDNLQEVSGFENLRYAGRFDISDNSNLESIPDFNKVEYVDNYISISNNAKLPAVNGFANLQTISANGIQIVNNEILESISGFQNLLTANRIRITDNNNLTSVAGFNELDNLRSDLTFENNSSLTTIPTFNMLQRIGSYTFNNNDALINLEGMENLDFVNARLYITQNDLLTGIPTFSNLDTILFEDLYIKENMSLNQITGFQSLKYAEGIQIAENQNLSEIDAFQNLVVVGDESFENPAFGYSGLYIEKNNALSSIIGFEKIDSIRGICALRENPALEALPMFNALTDIYDNFELIDNQSLVSFEGFENLERVGRSFEITGNDNLEVLPNVRQLNFIGESLDLRDGKFSSLANFSGLTKLGEFTYIYNTQIESLGGLDNIDPIDRYAVYISSNTQLSECAISSMCSFIDLYPERCFISDNADGCNSCEELDCEGITVSGYVFYDFNMNKVKDDDEVYVDNIPITLLPDDVTALTRIDGRYLFICEPGVSYNIQAELGNDWLLTTDSSDYNFVFENGNPDNHLNIFGIVSAEEKHDIDIALVSDPTRCNIEVDFHLDIKNVGTYSESGIVSLCIDSRSEFVESFPAPKEINGNCITWDFSGLNPYQGEDYKITLLMPDETNTGEPLFFEASVDNQDGFINPIIYTPTVICSYDPNDKLVMPSGFSDQNYIVGDENLVYTIRFQNDGNAEAINIAIEDTLSQLLDINTFSVLSSSFPVYTYITDNNVQFKFDNIWLPPSSLDETASQGYVSFSIRPILGLAPLTQITNEAFIYFDFNAAIQTNLTINTIEGVGQTDNFITDLMTITPNPASGHFCINLENDGEVGTLGIYDLKGNCLETSNSTCMQLSEYAEGLYIVKYALDNKVFVSKLILNH